MTWKHPHSSAKKFKTGQSPGKVMAADTAVFGVLLVDFTPPDSTINETALQESKETPGTHTARDTMMLTDGFLDTTLQDLTVLLHV